MPRVPFAFESEGPSGNSATKQLLNYHSSNLKKLVEWPNGNLASVFSRNCHFAV